MNRIKSQQGSAFVIIIIILAIIVITVLGFIFWQNFIQTKETQTPASETNTQQESPEVVYKTFTTDKHNVAFQYPESWTVEETYSDDRFLTLYSRTYTIETDTGNEFKLSMGSQGIGGTCGESDLRSRHVLEAEPVDVEAKESAFLSYIVYEDEEGNYVGRYGLTDVFKEVKDYQGCPNTFYVFIKSTNSELALMGFGGSKEFSSFDNAKQFMNTDDYKAIKKAISSLTYD
jgi:hypothetical protein